VGAVRWCLVPYYQAKELLWIGPGSEEIEEAKLTRKKPRLQYVFFLLSVSCEAFLVQ
jgi:hypothetical protein